MDTRDGRIYTPEEVSLLSPGDKPYLKPMEVDPTPTQRARRKVGRNEPCPCGSQKKFKKCCLAKVQAKRLNVVRPLPPGLTSIGAEATS